MFWSDIGRSVISSAAMDGTSRTDIVTDVSAYGLAIDFQGNSLEQIIINEEDKGFTQYH